MIIYILYVLYIVSTYCFIFKSKWVFILKGKIIKYFNINYLWKTFLLSLPIFAKSQKNTYDNLQEWKIIADGPARITIDDINYFRNKTAICDHEAGHVLSVMPEWRDRSITFGDLRVNLNYLNVTFMNFYTNETRDEKFNVYYGRVKIYNGLQPINNNDDYYCINPDYFPDELTFCLDEIVKSRLVAEMTASLGGSTADEMIYNKTLIEPNKDLKIFNYNFGKLTKLGLVGNKTLVIIKNELQAIARTNINKNKSRFEKLSKSCEMLEYLNTT